MYIYAPPPTMPQPPYYHYYQQQQQKNGKGTHVAERSRSAHICVPIRTNARNLPNAVEIQHTYTNYCANVSSECSKCHLTLDCFNVESLLRPTVFEFRGFLHHVWTTKLISNAQGINLIKYIFRAIDVYKNVYIFLLTVPISG
jgi:hypothetical protein